MVGQPYVVLIRGRAGIGKSSLMSEWLGTEQAGAFTVLRAACHVSEAELHYATVGQLFGSTTQGREGPWAEGGHRASSPPPAAMGAQLLYLLEKFESQGQPVALAVDDVHSADARSLQSLGFALRRMRGRAVLVMVTTRLGAPAQETGGAALGVPRSWIGPRGGLPRSLCGALTRHTWATCCVGPRAGPSAPARPNGCGGTPWATRCTSG